MPEIFTAVSLDETASAESSSSLEKPLLASEEDSQELSSQPQAITELYPAFRFHGAVIGFLVQLLNVAGSTVLYYQWPNSTGLFSKVSTDLVDTFFHVLVFLITQVDLYLYIFMWIALTAILTRRGMQYVQDEYFNGHTNIRKRSIFVLGVQFYIGVVVGVFCAWTAIDCLLGLPVPVLPMLGVLVFGLLISYTMVFCYDLEDSNEDADEDFEAAEGV